jgi:hypothetical protein
MHSFWLPNFPDGRTSWLLFLLEWPLSWLGVYPSERREHLSLISFLIDWISFFLGSYYSQQARHHLFHRLFHFCVTTLWLHNGIFNPIPRLTPVFTLMSVTVDGVWIGNRIYWTLWYSAWLHFTVHCYRHTHSGIYSNVFTAIAWYRLSTTDVPLPLGSWNVSGLSYQLLTATAHNWTPVVI